MSKKQKQANYNRLTWKEKQILATEKRQNEFFIVMLSVQFLTILSIIIIK